MNQIFYHHNKDFATKQQFSVVTTTMKIWFFLYQATCEIKTSRITAQKRDVDGLVDGLLSWRLLTVIK